MHHNHFLVLRDKETVCGVQGSETTKKMIVKPRQSLHVPPSLTMEHTKPLSTNELMMSALSLGVQRPKTRYNSPHIS